MKESGTVGPSFLLKIGKSPVSVEGVAAITTAVQNIAENSPESFMLVLITRQGAWCQKSVIMANDRSKGQSSPEVQRARMG